MEGYLAKEYLLSSFTTEKGLGAGLDTLRSLNAPPRGRKIRYKAKLGTPINFQGMLSFCLMIAATVLYFYIFTASSVNVISMPPLKCTRL